MLQGLIVEPMLWNVLYNGKKDLPDGCRTVAYADDLVILVEGNTIPELEMRAKAAYEAVYRWMSRNGLEICQEKTEYVVNRGWRAIPEPALTLRNSVRS